MRVLVQVCRRAMLAALLTVAAAAGDAQAQALFAPLDGPFAAAQEPAAKPKPDQQKPKKQPWRVRFIWNDPPPSLRFRRIARIDFRVKLQADWSEISPYVETLEGAFHWNRVRFGLEGDFADENVEYQIEYETTNPEADNPWRDVYLNVRYFRNMQIQGGKFKLPFSLEQLTGAYNQDFIYRSLPAVFLAPARDIGVMLHGRFRQRALNYEAGMFRQDGENGRSDFRVPPRESELTLAGRMVVRPFQLGGDTSPLKDLEAGGAFTFSDIPEGRNSLRGEMTFGHDFTERLFVKGRRLRLGLELSWKPGPFGVQAEFIEVREQRKEQSFRSEDLPDLLARGWYLAGSWVVTGEPKAGGIVPRRKFPLKGIGAIELATRIERLRFSSVDKSDEPLRNPRAYTVYPNSDLVWTTGVNWYPWRLFKVQVNGIREKLEDIERRPIATDDVYWTVIGRIQFVL
jgi:phosphate-selective porin OprO/OprP